MMRDPYDDSGKIIVYIGGLIIIVMLAFLSIKVTQDRKQRCELNGGEFHIDRSGGICRLKDALK